jgi:hypothetical protein
MSVIVAEEDAHRVLGRSGGRCEGRMGVKRPANDSDLIEKS